MKLFSKHIFWLASLAAIFCSVQDAKAQDPRYSQYYAAPARVNPALAGVIDGAWRAGINYRTQWGSIDNFGAYNSGSFTADGKTAVFNQDFLGFGFNAMYDRGGRSGYSLTEVGLDVNYQKTLYSGGGYGRKDWYQALVAGAHIGIGSRSVNFDRLTFSNQFDSTQRYGQYNWYNINSSSGENAGYVRNGRIYPDFHAGLLWYGTFGKRMNAYGGFSINHINRPDISIFDRPAVDTSGTSFGVPLEKLYIRNTIHGGGEILVGGRGSSISLLPGAVLMFQGPSTEINTGLSMKYQAPKYDDFALRLGIWNRVSNFYVNDANAGMGLDAIIFHVGLDYNQMTFGISYDVTMSSVRVVNNSQGSLEFSMFYVFDGDHRRRMGCPTF